MREQAGEVARTSPKKVSILMLTFRHEEFVEQAVESVRSQEVDFEIELVIGDDCSDDRTREILADLAARHPDEIRLLLPRRNLGVRENFRATLAACRGEYVAILEGDDFWTDRSKLQRQVELLDTHPDVPLCGHQSVTVEGSQEREGSCWPSHGAGTLDMEAALAGTLFHTCTMMFRRRFVAGFPEAFWAIFPPDRALQILLAELGPVEFIERPMAAYRIHPGGVWSNSSRRRRREINLRFFRQLLELTKPCHHEQIRDEIFRRWRSAIRESAREKRFLVAFGHYAALLGSPRVWMRNPRRLVSRSLWVG